MRYQSLSEEELVKLHVVAMGRESSDNGNVPTGFTYFGQFIAHDIVPELGSRKPSRVVTRALNLDSLYGTGAYDGSLFDREGRLLISKGYDDYADDLIRDPMGKAVIPDLRNDENTIVSQMHLVFQKLHNRLKEAQPELGIEEIRNQVVRIFQSVVVGDFLKRLIDTGVYQYCFEESKRALQLDTLRIPDEFAHAAFRFGHSMVRSEYIGFTPDSNELPLRKLFRRSKKLTKEFEVFWPKFFPLDRNITKAESARNIDMIISPQMFRIPTENGRMVNIVEANLNAGVRAGLPKGLEFFDSVQRMLSSSHIHFDGLISLDNNHLDHINQRLCTCTTRSLKASELYLWPYLLLEAEHATGVNPLGALSSLVIAEVISNSIKQSRYSIWSDANQRFEFSVEGLSEILAKCEFSIEDDRGYEKGKIASFLTMHQLTSFIQ